MTPTAPSHRAGRRWWNRHTPERYIATVTSGRSPVAGEETLTSEQRRFEGLVLALRTAAGVPVETLFTNAAGGSENDFAVLDDEVLDGLVERQGPRAVLTLQGRLLVNEVAARLSVAPRGDEGA